MNSRDAAAEALAAIPPKYNWKTDYPFAPLYWEILRPEGGQTAVLDLRLPAVSTVVVQGDTGTGHWHW